MGKASGLNRGQVNKARRLIADGMKMGEFKKYFKLMDVPAKKWFNSLKPKVAASKETSAAAPKLTPKDQKKD